MKFILKILLSAIVVVILSKILPGVAVSSMWSAVIVALVLAFLNTFIKPLLVLFTLPVTIVSLGLFLIIINAAIILMADYFIGGFNVNGWFSAILFSILLSIFQSILYSILKEDKK
ncbi:phage holin family protein [Aquimarina rhabdastrellae]